MKKIIICILISSICFSASAKEDLKIAINKSAEGIWTLKYKSKDSIKKIAFKRNPDNSRLKRWTPISEQFEIIYQDNQEYIVRKDRTEFNQVRFTLTPTYTHLAKDYGPFAPFSDGGMLIHSGRFFACVDFCDDDANLWKLSLKVPAKEHIILDGKVQSSNVQWEDKNSGQNIYVGKQQAIETEDVIAVIDVGLPEKIKSSLSTDIPKMMDYFRKRLGKMPYANKPTLYASYAKIEGNSSQGGTLPNQIFMHWNTNNLESQVKKSNFINQTTWFFAHEVAHLYQGNKNGGLGHDASQSWIHEGNADMLASLVLLDLYPESKAYVESKFKSSKKHCINGLSKMALADAADNGQFGLYYSCGLFIHSAIDIAVKNKSQSKKNIYTIWNEYRSNVSHGKPADQETFLTVVNKYASEELSVKIKEFVSSSFEQPSIIIDRLAAPN